MRWFSLAFFILGMSLFATNLSAAELVLFADQGLKAPCAEIVKNYEKETGDKVEVRYGEVNELFKSLITELDADLFLSGDEFYTDQLAEDGETLGVYELVKRITKEGSELQMVEETSAIAVLISSKHSVKATAVAKYFTKPASLEVFLDAGFIPLNRVTFYEASDSEEKDSPTLEPSILE